LAEIEDRRRAEIAALDNVKVWTETWAHREKTTIGATEEDAKKYQLWLRTNPTLFFQSMIDNPEITEPAKAMHRKDIEDIKSINAKYDAERAKVEASG